MHPPAHDKDYMYPTENDCLLQISTDDVTTIDDDEEGDGIFDANGDSERAIPGDFNRYYRRVSGAISHVANRMSYYEAGINENRRGSSKTLPVEGGHGGVACRNKSFLSMPNNIEGEVNSRSSLREDFVVELQEIRTAFLAGLQDADRGNEQYSYMLDMNLTRNLSVLPEDLVAVSQLICDLDQELGDEETTSVIKKQSTIPIGAYLLLLSAVVGLSAIGPLLSMQPGVDPLVKIYWRMCASGVAFFPLAAVSYTKSGLPQLSVAQWMAFLLAAAGYVIFVASFVVALDYTTVGNAVILSNAQSLIMLVGKLFMGDKVLGMEAVGALLAFAGAALCSKDAGDALSADAADRGGANTLLGDFFAVLAAVGGVGYLALAKTIRPHIDISMFVFLVMVIGSMYVMLTMTIVGTEFSLDFDIDHGLFGWTHFRHDRLPVELILVLLCNIVGVMGYVRAMQYFDNLAIAVAGLLEPVVAEMLAVCLGVGVFPGLLGWVGNGMVAVGTMAVIYPAATKSV